MGTDEKTKLIVWGLILFLFVGGYLGFSDKIMSAVTGWGASLIAGTLISGAIGTLVESLTGDTLKRIALPISIGPLSFSVTAFFIVTLIVRFVLFR